MSVIAPRPRLAIALAIFLLAPSEDATAACKLSAFGTDRRVSRVLDAETLQLDDGAVVKLANVLAPMARDLGIPPGRLAAESAAQQALDDLVTGKSVRLWVDEAAKDRHGAVRAHVRLGPEPTAPHVQADLARAGHVRALARHGERACIDEMIAAEADARQNARGLWSDSAFRVRSAGPAGDLRTLNGTFQLVEGEVHSIERWRDMTRLLLGPNRHSDVSVSLRSNDRVLVGALGGDLKSLVGQRIEARGWLQARPGSRGGPDIDVSLAGHVRQLQH